MAASKIQPKSRFYSYTSQTEPQLLKIEHLVQSENSVPSPFPNANARQSNPKKSIMTS